MGKHSLKNGSSRRNIVAAAAIGVGAVVALPATAQAAPVQVPGTDFSVDVPNEVLDAAGNYVDTSAFTGAAAAAESAVASAAPTSTGQKISDAAMSKQGAPYVWGATGPSSFDCSGLTSWAYNQVGKSIPRTSGAQASGGTPVSLNALQPGDIISYYSGASHVAIYIGDGKIVHAVNEGTPVQVNDINYMPINNAVRF
ncbi:C40 family peptidase [Corynebacterium variabile]|uniref:Putative secreted protein n=1 Tax=Corynebacterium variabile (strain DSM 44702 / CIP 107183 / JCM 12073 / NCIMB 30131) TaxID=858619 RepID=G0HEA1_CORVD|nr:C40 family peptidase [Corynebacterium variabile]AEK36493.1 putative secreted protein [Corynebacterium variabile DSM 44702]